MQPELMTKSSNLMLCMQGLSTALHIAVQEQHRQVAFLLLFLGADINAQDKVCTASFFPCCSS
jgi:hypothetical protein